METDYCLAKHLGMNQRMSGTRLSAQRPHPSWLGLQASASRKSTKIRHSAIRKSLEKALDSLTEHFHATVNPGTSTISHSSSFQRETLRNVRYSSLCNYCV